MKTAKADQKTVVEGKIRKMRIDVAMLERIGNRSITGSQQAKMVQALSIFFAKHPEGVPMTAPKEPSVEPMLMMVLNSGKIDPMMMMMLMGHQGSDKSNFGTAHMMLMMGQSGGIEKLKSSSGRFSFRAKIKLISKFPNILPLILMDINSGSGFDDLFAHGALAGETLIQLLAEDEFMLGDLASAIYGSPSWDNMDKILLLRHGENVVSELNRFNSVFQTDLESDMARANIRSVKEIPALVKKLEAQIKREEKKLEKA